MDVPYDLTSYVRVLKMATTPTTEEFLQVSKIAGAGIFLVGLVGFIIGAIMLFISGGGGI
ncbi:preprotein translocase subunit SecE [Natrinema mahii]|uniref:Protein translocase subunit SecE n=3 Tax=Natrinema TaxID=88723 RepID=A0A1S8AV73_9EURY|nr:MULTISPECIES: protein translocase SEC61 complex subunit gamma [Natrinema]ELZ09854.1 preprotein translocase subunit SecE [Natrinema thermotolerans DSM 11552]OAQ52574.1 preprotein translocase subunit SecE [Natrinema mahii]AGB31883.1 protein translocase SEC61 complex gamma subunit, archaeal and eukaryotic [Natrinema pellirubrum DSM 15624]ELY77770.1 preprotein translocase subunit SecE [Natrinema pellirubrum DSM 15624]OLZ40743.1 preprotein translocase subunit SecE [Natrinema saccharevitans]